MGRRLVGVLVGLAALAAPASAPAAPSAEVGIADDRVLLHGDPATAREAVRTWKRLGVDAVRIHARWVAHVPDPDATRPPAGFDGRDPDTPGYRWDRLDAAVDLVRQEGLEVMLAITGSGPLWGSRYPVRGSHRYKPDPRRFGAFATAVARRYGDRVGRYLLWNEPNQPLWLQPQFRCARGRCTPESPHLYRRLVAAAYPAIKAADPTSLVLFGALAPGGGAGRSANQPMRPLAFLRAMGCVDSRYRRLRTGPCRGFRPAVADGFAYHPHGDLRGPSVRSRIPDEARIGDLARVTGVLDRVNRAGGLRVGRGAPGRGRFTLWLTEFGYQTRPPDPYLGVSPARQRAFLQEAAFIAWKAPRVRNITQYAWVDDPVEGTGPRAFSGWQSGLLYADGRAKPALAAFPHPFWVQRLAGGRRARLWGQVRPGGAHTVSVQRRSGTGWRTVAQVATSPAGYWTRVVRVRATTSYRFAWIDEDGASRASDARTVRPTRARGGAR